MEAVLVEFGGDGVGDGELGDHPVLSGGHAAHCLERVTVVETDLAGAGVELVPVGRGHRFGAVTVGHAARACPQHREFGGRRDRPLQVTVGADGERRELDRARILVEGGAQDRITAVVEDDRAAQLQIVHTVRRTVGRLRSREGHLDVDRPGHHDAALHPVIGQEPVENHTDLGFPGRMHPAHRLSQQRVHRAVEQRLRGLLRFVPVPLGLPGVRRELDQSPRPVGVQCVPSDVVAGTMQSADAAQQRAGVVLIAALRRGHRNTLSTGGFEDGGGQHRVRRQLDEVRVTVFEHASHRRLEKHGGAGVLPPVRRARLVAVQQFTGDGGVQGEGGVLRRQSVEGVQQLVLDGLHVVRVVRHLDRQVAVEHLVVAELAGDVVQHLAVARQRDRRRAVDRRHRHSPAELGDRIRVEGAQQRLGVEPDGEHPAQAGGALLQSAAVVDHLDRLLEREQTRQVVGSDFPGTVPDHGVRTKTELGELLGQGELHSEVRRLRELGFPHPRAGFVAKQFIDEGPVRVLRELPVAAFDRVGEGGKRTEQSATHPPPLRAHA